MQSFGALISRDITAARIGLLAAIGALAISATTPASAGTPPHWCECVEFVKNSFSLHGTAGNAKDMGPFLAKNGFRRSEVPAIGAVAIIQPAFYKTGAGAIYGHSAVIESLAPAGKSGWFLGLRSANQTGPQFTGAGCSNVTFKSIGPIDRNSKLVTYWIPPGR